jgi:hypothetical protein
MFERWDELEIAFIYRLAFLRFPDAVTDFQKQQLIQVIPEFPHASFLLQCSRALPRYVSVLQNENSRLNRLSFLVSPLLNTVKRREALKHQLRSGEVVPPKNLSAHQAGIAISGKRKQQLQEYKKLTHTLRLAIIRWQRQHGIPFQYRGIGYLDDMRIETEADRLAQEDQAVKRALRSF